MLTAVKRLRLLEVFLQRALLVGGKRVAPDAVATFALGGRASGRGFGGGFIDAVLAVLELEEIAGDGTGEILGVESGDFADFKGVFSASKDVGIMAGTAVDAAGAFAIIAFAFALSFAIA